MRIKHSLFVQDFSAQVVSFVHHPEIMVSRVTPRFAPVSGTTVVNLIGLNFLSGCWCRFGDVEVLSTFVNDTFVRCMLPSATFPGFVSLEVSNNFGVDYRLNLSYFLSAL